MRGRAPRTIPIEPLLVYLKSIDEHRDPDVTMDATYKGDRPSAKRLGALVGVDSRTIQRIYARNGKLSVWEADRFATRLGRHPIEIWGDAYLAAPDGTPPHPKETKRRKHRLICEACGQVFYAMSPNAKTGTTVCTDRLRNHTRGARAVQEAKA